jgi:putative membrane protein
MAWVVGSFTLLSVGAASAQTGAAGQAGQAGTTAQSANEQRTRGDGSDQDFLKKAVIANLAEIELGRLAAQKAQNPEVKQFAQMMVDGHTKALDELKQLAQRSGGAELPATLDEKHQDLKQKLSGLSGEEFDREYMEAMIDEHQDVEDMLEDRVGEEGRPGRSDTTAGTSGSTSGTTGGTAGTTGGTTTGTTAGAASARANNNPALDAWAQKTLQSVRTHLQQAKDIKDRIAK